MPFSVITAARTALPLFLASTLTSFSAPAPAKTAAPALTLLQELKSQAVSNLIISPHGSLLYTSFNSQRGDATVGSYQINSGDTLSPMPLLREAGLPASDGLPAVSVPLPPVAEITDIDIQRASFGVL